jgi:hypothetical protein
VKQVRLERKEVSNIPESGRERDDGITDAIADKLAGDSYLSAKKVLRRWVLGEVQWKLVWSTAWE